MTKERNREKKSIELTQLRLNSTRSEYVYEWKYAPSPSTSIVMLDRFWGSITSVPSPCSLPELDDEEVLIRGAMFNIPENICFYRRVGKEKIVFGIKRLLSTVFKFVCVL